MGYTSKNQGYFNPRNPDKYVGSIDKIQFRSSWELHFNKFLDNNPNILRWSSEEISIPYRKPTTGKIHKYWPDYWIEYKDKDGNIKQELIEVKPKAQTAPPKQPKRPSKSTKANQRRLNESITYAVNVAKWKSAEAFCKKHGLTFRIVTEEELFR